MFNPSSKLMELVAMIVNAIYKYEDKKRKKRKKKNQYAEYKWTHKCMGKANTTILMQSFAFVALGELTLGTQLRKK